jgi:hypothetical protein
MLETAKGTLKEYLQKDLGQLEEYKTFLEENNVPFKEIDCDRSIEKVFDSICHVLRSYLEQRQNKLE